MRCPSYAAASNILVAGVTRPELPTGRIPPVVFDGLSVDVRAELGRQGVEPGAVLPAERLLRRYPQRHGMVHAALTCSVKNRRRSPSFYSTREPRLRL